MIDCSFYLIKKLEIMVNMNYKSKNRVLKKSHLLKLSFVVIIILCFFALLSGVSAKNFNNTSTNAEIQDFINNQVETDNEIVFDAGNYSGLSNLNISRSIKISTNGTVHIQGTSTSTLFNITSANVSIINLNISGYATAISSTGSSLSLINNTIATTNTSIDVSNNSLFILLENNTIKNTAGRAININASNNSVASITLRNNNIDAFSYGLYYSATNSTSDLIFENNIITATDTSGYGIYIVAHNSTNSITFTNNNITAIQDRPPNSISVGNAITLSASNSTNSITFTNNSIAANMTTVSIGFSYSNNTINIINNNFTSERTTSFSFSGTYGNNNITAMNNNFISNGRDGQGFRVMGSRSNNTMMFTHNNFTGSEGFYLELYFSDYNVTFLENNITGRISALRFDVWGDEENIATLYVLNNTLISDMFGIVADFYDDSNATNNAIVMGNTIIADIGIMIVPDRPFADTLGTVVGILFSSLFNMTANYNIILAPVGIYSMIELNNSNFDYNFWGSNNIDDRIINASVKHSDMYQYYYDHYGPDYLDNMYYDLFGGNYTNPTTNNHYILNITNLTSLNNLKVGDTVNFALLVLNTTLTNEGVENLPFFTINGTFNNKAFTTNRDQLFVYTVVLTEKGSHQITTSMSVTIPDVIIVGYDKQYRRYAYLTESSYELYLELNFDITEFDEDIPELRSNAVDKATGSKNIIANGTVTIVDTVTYTNLLVGETYTINGILMDKATGNPVIINGAEVRTSKTFVASSVNGSVEIEFTFDASNLGNRTLVVFEKLFYNGVEIAAHEDINDLNQTVVFNERNIKIFDEEIEDEKEVEEDVDEKIEDTEQNNKVNKENKKENKEQNTEEYKEDIKVNASMKSTGIPMVILLIIAIFGLIVSRRKY